MNAESIFLPALALIGLTFIVGVNLLLSRIGAVRRQEVSVSYFVLLQGDNIPIQLLQNANNFSNLFAVPLLFYVLCVIVFAINAVDSLFVYLAWAFFITRLIHSVIHLTYNNLPHRMLAFLAGLVIVFVMWLRLVLALL